MMRRVLSWLLTCVGLAGCEQAERRAPLPVKQLIESYSDAPLGRSINDVSHGLANCSVMIPTEGVHVEGQKLKMKTSADNRGRQWAYVYTDEAELLAAFPNGSPFVRMHFADFFGILENDSRFGGVFINRTDKCLYLIPRDVLPAVRKALDSK